MTFNNDGIDLNNWKEELENGESATINSFHQKVKEANHRNSVFIDNTANQQVSEVYEKYLIENNYPIFDDKKNYYNYPNPILIVFDYDNFHKNIVQHLFAGQDEDGWCKERSIKLM
mgnify:CR=1 FL=1